MSRKRNPIVQEDVEDLARADLPWSRFDGKSVLISGANGFLPAYMVETLAHLNEAGRVNCKLLLLVRNFEKAKARFPHLLDRPDSRFIVQDVCSPINLDDKVDFIVHAASQASPKYFGKDPVGTLLANTLGTNNLLLLAQANNLEGFLFFSSGDVYGRNPAPEVSTTEDGFGYLDPTDVRSCYGESKRLGETMCISYSHQYGIPVQIARPSHTYGPGMALDDARVFADFTANIVRHENIVVKSSGAAKRPFCYLADAVRGLFTVMLKGGNRQAYNVGNEDCYLSIAELALALTRLFPERHLKADSQAGFDQQGYIPSTAMGGTLDTSKLRALGWKPTTNVQDGFRRTVLSYETDASH
jgi:UDP-glucuronate decarboxylase